MTVTHGVQRSIVGLVAVTSIAACGSTGAAPDTPTTPSVASPNDVADTSLDVTVTVPGAADTPGTEIVEVDATSVPAMDIVASLGYPRDLLDRGRVNVKISRDDDTVFVVFDKQLLTDYFEPAPVEERRTILPPNGQVVALQTQFGSVADCAGTAPIRASIVLTFVYGDDPVHKRASFPLTDTSTLGQIRQQACTLRRVLAENHIELRNISVAGETMTADLVITRRSGNSRLGLESVKGTVLFGASTPFEQGDPSRVLEPDRSSLVLPIDIDVNRCDPHAVAETTRKFGIDLYVSVDGAEPQRIDVPIDPILDDLESMLDTCKARTGQ